MKIFIVVQYELYGDEWTIGVFNSKEKAERYVKKEIKQHSQENYYIQEWNVS